MSIQTTTVSIPGSAPLAGTMVTPEDAPNTVVVLNGATGVPHSYYVPFAKWLAETQGMACLLFDYRDFGASSQAATKNSKADMADWGIQDQQAARDYLSRHFPEIPLWVIGHSLGGFMLPFQTGLQDISRVIAIASGPAHIKAHPWPYRLNVWVFWYLLGPVLAAIFGYLPGRFSGLGADLPVGVFRQWKRWCTSHRFYCDDRSAQLSSPNWDGLTSPLKTVSFTDDLMVPCQVVETLAQFYPKAPHTHMSIDPQTYGLKQIGHLKAFSKRNAAIWPELVR